MNRWASRIVAALLALLVASPALGDPPRDDFPLSTYPMFAVDRGEVSSVSTAVGRTVTGERVRLSPRLLAGTDEPILAVRTARLAVTSGESEQWCSEVATRTAARSDRGAITEIEVVTETHDSVRTLTESADPIRTQVHATCPVPR